MRKWCEEKKGFYVQHRIWRKIQLLNLLFIKKDKREKTRKGKLENKMKEKGREEN